MDTDNTNSKEPAETQTNLLEKREKFLKRIGNPVDTDEWIELEKTRKQLAEAGLLPKGFGR